MTTARLVLLALVPLLAVPGCGTEETTEPGGSPETMLTITVWPKGREAGEPTSAGSSA